MSGESSCGTIRKAVDFRRRRLVDVRGFYGIMSGRVLPRPNSRERVKCLILRVLLGSEIHFLIRTLIMLSTKYLGSRNFNHLIMN